MSATARTDTSATTLFAGTERFFRPGYAANLVSGWIPALDGVEAKLRSGRARRRHRLRPRGVDDPDGAGVPAVALRGVRLPRRIGSRRGEPQARRSASTCSRRSPRTGTWLIVEPYAGDRLEDNLGPVGRVFYGSSARPPRATRRSGSRSAPRRARRASARSSPRAGSRASGVPPRRLSTSCWRRARNG